MKGPSAGSVGFLSRRSAARGRAFVRALGASLLLLGAAAPAGQGGEPRPADCTYRTYVWNTVRKRAEQVETVRHPYAEPLPGEVDPLTGCTVCSEDQEPVDVPPLAPFLVCRKIAPGVRKVLTDAVARGEPVFEVVGYRVGRTRGPADEAGRRTRFSNHSYGTAVDVNPALNGLYDRCLSFGPGCRLVRGGPWRPGVPGTLAADGPIVKAFGSIGFRWGGHISGRQKDFMHFSPTGY